MTTPVVKQEDNHRTDRVKYGRVRSIFLSPWYIPVVITLAFAIRLCWLLVFHPHPVSDFSFYFRSAESIARGLGYSHNGTSPTAYFPIGYSLFLGMLFRVFGISVAVAQAANLVLSVASLVLAYWIARDLFRSELAGRLSILLLAIYPDNIAYASLVGVETLHLFLLFLGVTLLLPCISIKGEVRPWRLLSAGVLFGFATLCKAQTLLLPMILLILFPRFSWNRRSILDRLKKTSILYAALIVVLIPWVIRNYRLYNDFVFSNNDGLNLYIGNGPEADGTFVTIPWFDVGDDTRKEYEVNTIARRKAIDYMETHPLRTLQLMPRKLIALFDNGDGTYWNMEGTKSGSISARRVLPLLDQINAIYEFIVIVFFVLSVAFGCWKRLRRGKGHGWSLLGVAVIVYFIGIYLVYFGSARFHFPIIPWMMMYSAALLSSLFPEFVS
jgi:4-amino-4-deoxy-L-arabinose transferase-like glycosyltransferase